MILYPDLAHGKISLPQSLGESRGARSAPVFKTKERYLIMVT